MEYIKENIFIKISFITLLSLLDAFLTLLGLNLGVIKEANPMMNYLIESNSVEFIVMFKLLLPVSIGCLILWQCKNISQRLIDLSLFIVLVSYSLVMLLHCYWMFMVLK